MIAKAKERAGSVRQSLGLTTHRAHEPTDARAGGAVISVPDLGMALNDDLGTPKPPLAIGKSGDTVNVSLREFGALPEPPQLMELASMTDDEDDELPTPAPPPPPGTDRERLLALLQRSEDRAARLLQSKLRDRVATPRLGDRERLRGRVRGGDQRRRRGRRRAAVAARGVRDPAHRRVLLHEPVVRRVGPPPLRVRPGGRREL